MAPDTNGGSCPTGVVPKSGLGKFLNGLFILTMKTATAIVAMGNNENHLVLKPTIINILFTLALFFGKYFTREPILKKIMGKSIPLSDIGWEILNKRWMFFFLGLAVLNEFIWRTQTEEFWVNFKVWGMLPITIIFTAFQIPLINKHKIDAQ